MASVNLIACSWSGHLLALISDRSAYWCIQSRFLNSCWFCAAIPGFGHLRREWLFALNELRWDSNHPSCKRGPKFPQKFPVGRDFVRQLPSPSLAHELEVHRLADRDATTGSRASAESNSPSHSERSSNSSNRDPLGSSNLMLN